ncbi:MAG: AraC family transcriptional regulator [Arenimonas sp.]|jgi:AraC-like DNA-binding protein
MDALSDVLNSVRLEGAVFLNAEFTAPWCVLPKFGLGPAKTRLSKGDHIICFHFLSEGDCKIRLADGMEVLSATAGDLILFPQDERHVMGSDLQLVPVETANLFGDGSAPDDDVLNLRHGGGGAAARFICGYLACSRSVCRPLLEALPRVLRIPVGDGPAAALLRDLLRAGVSESATLRPGAGSVLAKLSELMFVEAMRRYVGDLPPGGMGWLAGVRDAHVGRALALLHGDPGRAWTVDELAREVALSRSALAERFATLVGEPPIQYLMRWRLALAAQTLRSSGDAITRVAERSGYDSEAAFSRAFKREFGAPPAAWRRAGSR